MACLILSVIRDPSDERKP